MTKQIHVKNFFNAISFLLILSSNQIINGSNKIELENINIFFSQLIKQGDLVFDVGAFIGNKTEIFLNYGAKVVCFEPQEICINFLASKFACNKNVTIVQKGLSYEHGYIDFFECTTAKTISTFSKEWTTDGRFVEQGYSWKKPIKIEVTTLDEMIKIYGIPKFCKIDVEGFEYEVLKGLSTIIPALSFEFTYENKLNTQKILDHLTSLGYTKFNFALAENPYFEFDEWLTGKILLERIYKENKISTDLWGDIYAKH